MLFSDNMENFRIVNETEIADEVINSNSSEKSAVNDDKHSTPLTSQEQSFFPSQAISNIGSPPPPKVKLKVTKFSKKDALDLLKQIHIFLPGLLELYLRERLMVMSRDWPQSF